MGSVKGAPSLVSPLGRVRELPLADVRPYPANARRITAKAVEQTAASLREFGWQQPLVTDTDLVLLVGHVRHRAAISLGETTGPVVVAAGLSEDQARAYRIADNRTHDYTTWDYGLLAAELSTLHEFAEVLDLADWEEVVARLPEGVHDGADLFGSAGPPPVLGSEWALTVIFNSEEARDRAGPVILETVLGVVNVRHPR